MGSAIRIASPSTRANGDLIMADVGQNNIEEIDRVVLGGNYGWAIKEGTFLVQPHEPRRRNASGANSPGVAGRA